MTLLKGFGPHKVAEVNSSGTGNTDFIIDMSMCPTKPYHCYEGLNHFYQLLYQLYNKS